jgi:4-hydroxyproline epimerase
MARHTFSCIDGHTCGNPVRLVSGGGPLLKGSNMMERRADFLANWDWIRKGLMFEPRGHDMMSGSILYPSTRDDCDISVLFIETSGCLYMCGHGTIGTVTMAIENGLMQPRTPGVVNLDVPAGKVVAEYTMNGEYVDEVRLTNVASFLHSKDLEIECPGLGKLKVDVAYGGNFYCIVDPQENFTDLADVTVGDLLRWSPVLRKAMNERYSFVHPENENIRGCTHIMWTGKPLKDGSTARNAVFYGDKAIDRSPCGTGTSARMAQWYARGKLKVGDAFIHESIIGSLFRSRVESETELGGRKAIVPSIGGWARMTGLNTIFIDDRDPFAHGFSLV